MTVTLTLDLPADLAERIHALPPATLNHFAVAALPDWLEAAEKTKASFEYYDASSEPADMGFVAELHAAFAEADQVGTIPFEEVLRRVEAEDEAAADLRRVRRQAAEKVLV